MRHAGWKDTCLGDHHFMSKIMYCSGCLPLYVYDENTEDDVWLHHAEDMVERLYPGKLSPYLQWHDAGLSLHNFPSQCFLLYQDEFK
jgi:hypothetical protein